MVMVSNGRAGPGRAMLKCLARGPAYEPAGWRADGLFVVFFKRGGPTVRAGLGLTGLGRAGPKVGRGPRAFWRPLLIGALLKCNIMTFIYLLFLNMISVDVLV